ncbi:SDR family NAD(P)-dependent oxidoreductase [Paraburkholderia sp. NPDC080076]|uniref:SDR family NAD(P)-dependent oxidoreductase n=1 Tax=Paraburkholderia sp. NPDC080076 TaxID=3390605 RepID=UPI003CFEA2FA
MNRFDSRVAVVTGGGSGIGEAVVKGLYAEGSSVVVVDTNEANAKRVADSLGDSKRVYAVTLDVTDRVRVEQVISDAALRFGRLDLLVNSAGIRGIGSVMDVDAEQWRHVHAVNLDGTLYMSQSFTRLVSKGGKPGAIVNVSSVAGIMGIPNRASYVSSKHAIVGLTREMAMEMGPLGIRVNAVAPGMIRTPMTEAYFQEEEGESRIRAYHPVGRAGLPEEVAAAILFLASDDASFVTGVTLAVDGGITAGRGW